MDELIKELQQATYHEYVRATKENGYCFNSGHEAYAVIKEEYEEAVEEMDNFADSALQHWEEVKDDRHSNVLSAMREYAIKAAAELIQTAAMCEKAMIRRMSKRVELVRCKDCDRYEQGAFKGYAGGFCACHGTHVGDNDFCSYGERRLEVKQDG